ncbi:hypothetical protein C4552_02095 [Candidatus Parcubacteria bacterium]|nr:MAG: hypothetical protein C4552_02095 [Candidatus Parcubacteria bacterium]
MVTKPTAIPAYPGVYIFRRDGTPIYVGKAANLKTRLGSYFQKRPNLGTKTERMLAEATSVDFERVVSEIDALIKEAELIKKFHPRFNVIMRDDKNYSFVGITKEPFPRIFVTHQPTDAEAKRRAGAKGGASYYGPFTSASELHMALKLLRRVFPYCTCKQPHKRPCLNSQIGRCPGVCCITDPRARFKKLAHARAQYRRTIRKIIAVLKGDRQRLMQSLKREMARAARTERYEEAARLRDELSGLESLFEHRTVIRRPDAGPLWQETEAHLRVMLGTDMPISRIEGYDISNISGTEATGSMVVFTDGRPDKSQYRKFRIKTVVGPNDVASHGEVLRRRFTHPEWHYPQLVVMDGGKPQLNAALAALKDSAKRDKIIGRVIVTALAKREEILFTADGRSIRLANEHPALFNLFRFIRNESHRFAQAYHHKLRQKFYAASSR